MHLQLYLEELPNYLVSKSHVDLKRLCKSFYLFFFHLNPHHFEIIDLHCYCFTLKKPPVIIMQEVSALNGDEVEVEMIAVGDPTIGKRPEGKITKIIQRNLAQVVGEFKPLSCRTRLKLPSSSKVMTLSCSS